MWKREKLCGVEKANAGKKMTAEIWKRGEGKGERERERQH